MKAFTITVAQAVDIDDLKSKEVESGLSPWTAAGYEAEMERDDALILKACSDDRTVGFIAGRMPVEESGEAEVYNIATSPNYRRQGIGSALLDAFLEKCGERMASGVWLEVRQSNESALRFYHTRGFVTLGKRPNFYSNPTDHAELLFLKLVTRTELSKS